MFDLNADWVIIGQTLRKDPDLRRRIDSNPGLRVPGCWDAFELAVRAILGQQVSVKAATTFAGRMVNKFGQPVSGINNVTHLFPVPEVVAETNLMSIGLTRARAESIRALARAACDGELTFLHAMDSTAFLTRLCEIPGIGKWTAQYVAMRALWEPDAFPSGDLGLLRALDCVSSRDLERRAEAWRPWRAYAAICLWSAPNLSLPRRKGASLALREASREQSAPAAC
jgi:AraC family transcriptional regulator of adaptative response / DNA-3-methyladenine glycosylase II